MGMYDLHMPIWAIIFKPWADEPVYHRQRTRAEGRELGDNITACGRSVSPHTPWLPTKHVVKFARPCRGCFPE